MLASASSVLHPAPLGNRAARADRAVSGIIRTAASVLALGVVLAAFPVSAQNTVNPDDAEADLPIPAPPADADLPDVEPIITDEEFETAIPSLDEDDALEGPLESIADFERRIAAEQADTLVTPMNDSFVDFDLIGQVDAETFKVKKLSFYAELIWEARLKRSRMGLEQDRRELDWVVVRNRTGYTEARNMARLEKALAEMSKRVGFRIAKGLSERVIYRELFPSGLTLLDKGHLGDLGTSHLVARQELRGLIASLRLPGIGLEDKAA